MKALLMAVCVCCTPSLHAGEVYKWTDEGGRVHYSDSVPPARRATATPVATAPQASAAASSCEEAWRRYDASAACFEPYRIKGGRVRPEAYQHCVDVPRPDPCE